MTIYLAAPYPLRHVVAARALDLRNAGLPVVSSWHDGNAPVSAEADASQARAFAEQDMSDLFRADVLVAFTQAPSSPLAHRSGHHTEVGMALARGRRVVLVGPRVNVFHHLPKVSQYDTWPEARAALVAGARPVEAWA